MNIMERVNMMQFCSHIQDENFNLIFFKQGNLVNTFILFLYHILMRIFIKFKIFFLFPQIVDGNAKTDVSNRREPGMFCGEAEQPQTFISETSYVKILFHAENFTDQVCI